MSPGRDAPSLIPLTLPPRPNASRSAACKPSEGDPSKRHVHSMFSLSSQSTLISGVERDSPLGILGCHLWHLLSLQKNKFKCRAQTPDGQQSCPESGGRL